MNETRNPSMAAKKTALNIVGRKLPASSTIAPTIATARERVPQATSKPKMSPPMKPNRARIKGFTLHHSEI